MSDNYVIWKYKHVRSAAILSDAKGLDRVFRLKEGVPLLHELSGSVTFDMDPDFPTDLRLLDNMRNIDKLAVTSKRLKEAIEAKQVTDVEYLPVSIIDHKGRTASSDCFVVHQLNSVDAIDRERSVFEMSDIVPEDIDVIQKLVLDPERIPRHRHMFRLKNFGELILVRRDLADALSQGGFTGLTWQEIETYPG